MASRPTPMSTETFDPSSISPGTVKNMVKKAVDEVTNWALPEGNSGTVNWLSVITLVLAVLGILLHLPWRTILGLLIRWALGEDAKKKNTTNGNDNHFVNVPSSSNSMHQARLDRFEKKTNVHGVSDLV